MNIQQTITSVEPNRANTSDLIQKTIASLITNWIGNIILMEMSFKDLVGISKSPYMLQRTGKWKYVRIHTLPFQ